MKNILVTYIVIVFGSMDGGTQISSTIELIANLQGMSVIDPIAYEMREVVFGSLDEDTELYETRNVWLEIFNSEEQKWNKIPKSGLTREVQYYGQRGEVIDYFLTPDSFPTMPRSYYLNRKICLYDNIENTKLQQRLLDQRRLRLESGVSSKWRDEIFQCHGGAFPIFKKTGLESS